jgi:integrase
MHDIMLIQSIQDFINHRSIGGYVTNIYQRHMKQFTHYCMERGIGFEALEALVLTDYCYYKDESEQTRRARMNMMIHYAKYLQLTGKVIELPTHRNNDGQPTHSNPYIYSEAEIKRIFFAIDNWSLALYSNSNRLQMDPLLFRLYYSCGLRLREALDIQLKDVELDEGFLRIRNGKNGRSRIVPMADSVTERCSLHMDNCFGSIYHPEWYLFHYGDPALSMGGQSVNVRFRQYLSQAQIHYERYKTRIHDFRHTFCVHRLKKWVLEGKDLNAFLPYLSKYLGHVDFRGTEYYLRLTADLYPELLAIMKPFSSDIIPRIEEVQDGDV